MVRDWKGTELELVARWPGIARTTTRFSLELSSQTKEWIRAYRITEGIWSNRLGKNSVANLRKDMFKAEQVFTLVLSAG